MSKTVKGIIIGLMSSVWLMAQDYNEWIDRSFSYIEANLLDSAEFALQQALRMQPANPQNALLLSNLGTIQRNLGKREQSLHSYTNGLMMAPHSVTLLMNRAALYSEMDSTDAALTDYNRVLLLDEEQEEALYRRGLIRLEKGDTAACRLDFEQLFRINPASIPGRIGMGALLKKRHYYNDAVDLYTQILRMDPAHAGAYLGRAEACYYNKRYKKALEDVNKAIETDGEDPVAFVLRGKIWLALYEKEAANRDFEKAVTLGFDPKEIEQILEE